MLCILQEVKSGKNFTATGHIQQISVRTHELLVYLWKTLFYFLFVEVRNVVPWVTNYSETLLLRRLIALWYLNDIPAIFFYFDHNCADLCETDILWKLDFQMFPSLSPFIGKLKSWAHENLKIAAYSHVVGCTLMRWVNTVQRSLCFSSPQYGKHPVLLIVCSHYDWNLKHMTSSCWLASW